MDKREAVGLYRESIIRRAIRQALPTWPFGFFSICPTTEAATSLDIEYFDCGNDAYEILRLFHCWNYYSIPRQIRKQMPFLIREMLTDPKERHFAETAREIRDLEDLFSK